LIAISRDSILPLMAYTNDLLGIISSEHALHPRMVLSDLQKLIYQSVFGGDHLLENPARFADGVRHEWVGFDPPPAEAGPALQPIDPDGRTARIHLAVCSSEESRSMG